MPANPLIAEPMYLAKYIERMGIGIRDMIDRCRAAGHAEPEIRVEGGMWITTIRRKVVLPPVIPQQPESRPESRPESLEMRVLRLLAANPLSKADLTRGLGLKSVSGQLNKVIRRLLAEQHIAYTRPDSPNSRLQRFRITDTGNLYLESSRGDRP